MQSSFQDEYLAIEDTHWWFRGRRVILPDLLRRSLAPPLRVLDVGSSGGAVTETLLEFGEVTACDMDLRSVEAAQRHHGVRFVYGRAEELPFADASFDLVTSFDVIEHVDDDLLALKEITRVLCPGGMAAVAVPAYAWMWGAQDDLNGHRRRYGRRMLQERIREAGLDIERLTSFNSFLLPPIAVIRLARFLFRRARGGAASPGQHSDFTMTRPGRVNDFLAAVFGAERWLLRYADFPCGVSLFAFARKPATDPLSPR